MKQTEKQEYSFICSYCKYKFKQRVGSFGGGVDKMGRKISKITDKVKCPYCKTFLKSPKV